MRWTGTSPAIHDKFVDIFLRHRVNHVISDQTATADRTDVRAHLHIDEFNSGRCLVV